MMWQVITYTVAVSLAVSLIGLCEERLAVMRDLPRRFFWAFTMVLSIAWPLGMMLQVQPAAVSAQPVPVVTTQAPATQAQVTGVATNAPVQFAPLTREQQPTTAVKPPPRWHLPQPSNRAFVMAWAIASGMLLAWLCALDLLLHRRARRWQRETVLGRQVLVSEHTGPALLGVWRPVIVVPRWFLDESPATQSLILEHEQQHLRARDPLLLRVALLLAVMVPWNLPLWWQVRRMRRAIELDCDARVLRSGAEADSYGRVLLAVTQRAGKVPAGVVAMSEPASALEQRIANLVPNPARHPVLRAAAALLVWGAGFGVAASFEVPAMLNAAAQTVATPATTVTPAAPVASPRPAMIAASPAPAQPAVPVSPPPTAAKAPASPAPAVPAAATASDPNRTELASLISLAAAEVKKRFVVDPRVRGSVDAGALGPDFLTYHAFLEILGVHGFIAVPSGDVVTIIPDSYLKQVASPVARVDDIKGDDAEVVTVIIPVGDAAIAQQLAISLRQLVPQWGFINTTADQKSLLVVDKVANVKRLVALVKAQSPQP